MSPVLAERHHDAETNQIISHSAADFFCRQWGMRYEGSQDRLPKVLVAGCGAGHEAAYIAKYFPAIVEAFDIEHAPDSALAELPNVNFQAGSVEDIQHPDDSFDAVFYHHVIEHVGDPQASLAEIARVLAPNGWLFIGTPNRHRLVSSVGAHRQRDWTPSLRSKVKENLQDWSARLRGRFRNEYGAHAGFSQGELDRMLAVHFQRREWVTADYLRFKYAHHRASWLIQLATTSAFRSFLPPSIYAFCQ